MIVAVTGLVLGAFLLWLALRQFDAEHFAETLSTFDGGLLLAAGSVYWMAIACRSRRWLLLIREWGNVRPWPVIETLIVGYGVNYLLPARLGELVRADYGKHRLGMSRSRLLGTIVVERVMDLIAVLGCLFCGFIAGGGSEGRFVDAVDEGLRYGIAIVGFVGVALIILRTRWSEVGPGRRSRVMRELLAGIASLNARTGLSAFMYTALVWFCEAAALWLIFAAVHVQLAPGQILLLLGASSLSTLIPTAPGYVGSFQLVFVMAMSAFAIPETIGLVASTSIQIFLFGSVTLGALALYFRRWVFELKQEASAASMAPRENAAHG